MPKVKITANFDYFKNGEIHSYSLKPEMGTVSHLPRRVCEAAVEAGSAEYVKPIPRKAKKPQ